MLHRQILLGQAQPLKSMSILFFAGLGDNSRVLALCHPVLVPVLFRGSLSCLDVAPLLGPYIRQRLM